MKPRWKKVWIDLWENKLRTSLVVLSIAVGIFAVGMIVDSYLILVRASDQTYALTNPFSAAVISSPFDDNLVSTIRKMPEIQDAEGRRIQQMRIFLNDQGYSMDLTALDYDDMHINLLESTMGAFPPEDRQILIDETVAALADVRLGETALVETPDGERFEMAIAGFVRDMNANPSINSNSINAYCTFDTFEWLGYPDDYNRLIFTVKKNSNDLEYVQTVTGKVRDKIEGGNHTVLLTTILFNPGENPETFVLDAIRIVLGTLAVTSLCLSTFLVYNTISSLMMKHIKQIGIMKAIGAGKRDIIRLYFLLVLWYGFLAFLIAAPLAAYSAEKFSHFIASPDKLDISLHPYQIDISVLMLELIISLIIPLVAAAPSIIHGAGISVQNAILSRGLLDSNRNQGFLERGIRKLHVFSTPSLLAFGNTWRQKSRVGLTIGTLILGGSVFIGVLSVRDSSEKTIKEMGEAYRYDIEISFEQPYRIKKVYQDAMQIPGVINAEGWGRINGIILREDGEEGNSINIMAPPGGSDLTHPTILEGRWLLPGDENGIVIGTDLLRENPDLAVGDNIKMKIKNREIEWKIIGIYRVVGYSVIYNAYANYEYASTLVHQHELTQRLHLTTEMHDAVFQKAVADAAELAFRQSGYRVSTVETSSSLRGVINNQFDIIVNVELIMAALIMLVGSLGLAGTMSMNVMERTREIGIMRAIGATDRSIFKIILAEGLFIAIVSWFAAILLGIPTGMILSYALGMKMMNGPLAYCYSIYAAIIWLFVIILISLSASFLPAYHASKLTIRDVLAYE